VAVRHDPFDPHIGGFEQRGDKLVRYPDWKFCKDIGGHGSHPAIFERLTRVTSSILFFLP